MTDLVLLLFPPPMQIYAALILAAPLVLRDRLDQFSYFHWEDGRPEVMERSDVEVAFYPVPAVGPLCTQRIANSFSRKHARERVMHEIGSSVRMRGNTYLSWSDRVRQLLPATSCRALLPISYVVVALV